MEDIEYLEGYEDIVLPGKYENIRKWGKPKTCFHLLNLSFFLYFVQEISSCGDSFADKTVADTDPTVKVIATEKENYDDNDTSSSIDPDVFNYFFDVHSDDDTLPENKGELENNKYEEFVFFILILTVVHILNQKEDSMDSTDHLVKDLGKQNDNGKKCQKKCLILDRKNGCMYIKALHIYFSLLLLGEHITDELHIKSTLSETSQVSQAMTTITSTPISKTISKGVLIFLSSITKCIT